MNTSAKDGAKAAMWDALDSAREAAETHAIGNTMASVA